MSIEVMKQALEALEGEFPGWRTPAQEKAITSLRQAIANEALDKKAENARELGLDYEPPKRKWVGLTDKEVADLGRYQLWMKKFIRTVEAKLKEKNHVN